MMIFHTLGWLYLPYDTQQGDFQTEMMHGLEIYHTYFTNIGIAH
jgi:hypothetical protein